MASYPLLVFSCVCVCQSMPNCDDIVPAEWADSYEVEKNEVCESVHATISAGVWFFFCFGGGKFAVSCAVF